jgi:hypothetical protein
MSSRITSRLVGVAFLGLSATAASNCADQREPECTVAAAANFSVRLVETGAASGTCDPVPVPAVIEDDPATMDVVEGNTPEEQIQIDEATFLNDLRAPQGSTVVGLRPFVVLGPDLFADYDIPQRVAAQIYPMGLLQADAEARLGSSFVVNDPPVYAYGQFTTPTPQNDICALDNANFAPGRLVIPALPEIPEVPDDPATEDNEGEDRVPSQPPVDITTAWSNMRVLVTAGYPGIQFEATLTYTVNGCTRTYLATGVFGGTGPDTFDCEGRNPPEMPGGAPTRNKQPDQARCAPNLTGMNPDFPVVCDAETLQCLLDGSFPAIRPQ